MPPSEPNTDANPTTPEALPAPVVQGIPVARPLPVERDYEHVYDDADEFDFVEVRPRRPRKLARYVRVLLVLMAAGFAAVLGVALWLNPYNADGSAKTMETHRQLGLPRCNMVELTGKPCPACGMTTSFALLAHGDVLQSLRANWVGTLLCGSLILLTPWLVVSGFRGRLLWVRNGELFATILMAGLLLLMTGRWAWIMLFT
ncbi:MAG: DUF2752 domain-containing protein [Fimbriiglobus sp.]|nr:DUF2752 domain-containing protein [Fimbriiglobus sp.]